MRLNQFIAQATGMSRRAADKVIAQQRVRLNNQPAQLGQTVESEDIVTLDDTVLTAQITFQTIMLNKPVGYVVSRDGQGSQSIYDLLPVDLHTLKPVGRLDKDSSGLLLLTNDGQLAQELTHPKYQKIKKYKIALNKDLTEEDFEKITKHGVKLEDGLSKFNLDPINQQNKEWKVSMQEGRNRQIRRTFEALGYRVVKLHRTQFDDHELAALAPGRYKRIS